MSAHWQRVVSSRSNYGYVFVAGLVLVQATAAADAQQPIEGLGPVGEVTKLHGDFEFTEGPAADREGRIYFSDIPANKIYKVDFDGKLSTAFDTSNHANGLMFNGKGELVACEMDGQLVARDLKDKQRRVIAPGFEGKRFNAPNDLVIDRQGGIYMTDPHFRAPDPLPQGKVAVYYVTPKGEVARLIDNLPAPNGVLLSPDEKTLYVLPTGQADTMAYPVESPGKLGTGKVFFRLRQAEAGGNTGADGGTVDAQGNLYITSALGLQVVSPAGKLLGIIAVPEQPSNLTFGGSDSKTLYITARKSLYTAKMQVAGHRYSAGE